MILTRWHQDDPAGRILPEDWDGESGMIRRPRRAALESALPARDLRPLGRSARPQDRRDACGRSGSAMSTGGRSSATPDLGQLYQQRPAPERGSYFRATGSTGSIDGRVYPRRRYRPATCRRDLRKYGASSDYAVTEDGGDFTTHRIWGVDPNGDLWLLPGGYRAQATSDKWIEAKIDLMKRTSPSPGSARAG
jgi:hypothetical protein